MENNNGEEKDITPVSEPSQIDTELDKAKEKKSELEKALFSRKKIDQRIKELGGEVETKPTDEDDKPVTLGMLKKIQQDTTKKTALQLADSIEDKEQRDLVKSYLENRIVPSGDANADFRFALAAVSSLKNAEIATELGRKGKAKPFSSASGVDAKRQEVFEPTAEEKKFMSPPFNLTEEHIKKARQEKK